MNQAPSYEELLAEVMFLRESDRWKTHVLQQLANDTSEEQLKNLLPYNYKKSQA